MDIMTELDRLGAETEDAIERFMNDEEMYLKYIRDFPDEPTMPALVKAMEEKDYHAAERAVHTLKGIVNNLGLLPLADASMDMLTELREDNLEDALEAYEDVKEEYGKLVEVIRAWREA